MHLFAFHRRAIDDGRFKGKIVNLSRYPSRITARMTTGEWYLALIAAQDASFHFQRADVRMADTPLYTYTPTVDTAIGRSSDVKELFTTILPVTITENAETILLVRLDRNVAMVEVIVHKATANFDKAATAHVIALHHVPSTISYTGTLLPDKHTPDTLPAGQYLRVRVTLEEHPTENGYLRADTARFLLPAHRGSDFLD